jgi:hypothetical protein
MGDATWIRGIAGGCAVALCVAMAGTANAASKSWNQTGSGNRTDNLNDSANWTGGMPGTADDAYMVWTRSTGGPATKIITNKSTDVLDIRSMTITNQSSKDTVFIYIKGTTFLTNGPGALLFAGSTANPITLAFSNNVTFNTANFVGQSGNATLTFASGAAAGSNLTFTSGSGQNYLLVTGAGGLTLSGNLVATVNNANNAVIIGANSSVAGKLIVDGSQTGGLIVTNCALAVGSGVSNTGGIKIAELGILSIAGAWTNNGTLDIASTGALTGGTLTNQSNGTLTGSGFVKTLVINQGRVNFGGTVSNDFVQSSGSFTLSGNATITGSATINGGALNLLGKRLTSGGLAIASGGVLSNTVTGATLASTVANAGTVYFANDVYALGSVTNTGTWTHRGIISNNVVNTGTMTLLKNSINPRITGGVVNSGSLTMDANASATINGVVSNSGNFAFAGQLLGDYVQTGGTLTVASTGVANLNSVGGTASILGGVFNLNGRTYSNAAMIIAGPAVLTNGVANGAISGPMNNAGTVFLSANTSFKGAVNNTGTFSASGAGVTFAGLATNSGTMNVASGSAYFGQSFANLGILSLQSGTVTGAVVNAASGTIKGAGFVVGDLSNSGTISPGFSAGTLTITGNVNLASTGLLLMELIATNNVAMLDGTNDLLIVVGAGNVLTFGGTLTVTNMTGGDLSAGNSFQLFKWTSGASQSGDFAVTNLPGLNPGLAWDTTKLNTEGIITVIPEPSALLLVACGVIGALMGMRRRPANQSLSALRGRWRRNRLDFGRAG